MAVLFHEFLGAVICSLKARVELFRRHHQLHPRSLTPGKLQWTWPSNLKEEIRVMTKQWKEGGIKICNHQDVTEEGTDKY